MNNLNINTYLNKSNGDQLAASDWNGVLTAIQTKINEIISSLDNNGGGNGGDNQGDDTPQPSVVSDFYVNDTHYTTSGYQTLTLAAEGEYNLRGTYYGTIEIDAETAEPNAYTTIWLNGATIISNENYGIKYTTPAQNTGYKGMYIKLKAEVQNIIICNKEVAIADNQPAAIYSMNNMKVLGEGYLALVNRGGHGLRATELEVCGAHIYADVSHDAIHGSQKLLIDWGYFYTTACNNMFDTNGTGFYFGGIIHSESVHSGKLFDGVYNNPINGLYYDTYDTQRNRIFYESYSGGVHRFTDIDHFYDDVRLQMIDDEFIQDGDNIYGLVIGFTNKSDAVANTNGTLINPVNDIYHIEYPYVRIWGKISGQFVIEKNSTILDDNGDSTNNVDIYLRNAYVTHTNIQDTDQPYMIYFAKKNGRVKLISESDTINFIAADQYDNPTGSEDAVKSENNISIETKGGSVLCIQSDHADGIDGGDVRITDCKGTLIVSKCAYRGIKGNAIVIGPDANISSGVITSYITDTTSNDYKDLTGVVCVVNNRLGVEYSDISQNGVGFAEPSSPEIEGSGDASTISSGGYADIFARQGTKATKGAFGTTNAELKGALVCGSIGATISVDMGNAKNVWYSEIVCPLGVDATNTTNNNEVSKSGKAFVYDDQGNKIISIYPDAVSRPVEDPFEFFE